VEACKGCLLVAAKLGRAASVSAGHPKVTVASLQLTGRACTADGSGGAFVLTPAVEDHLRNLARAVLLRRYPILLQARPSSSQGPWLGERGHWCLVQGTRDVSALCIGS
jgi:hypothetical protein